MVKLYCKVYMCDSPEEASREEIKDTKHADNISKSGAQDFHGQGFEDLWQREEVR